jgi:hypothetical protein
MNSVFFSFPGPRDSCDSYGTRCMHHYFVRSTSQKSNQFCMWGYCCFLDRLKSSLRANLILSIMWHIALAMASHIHDLDHGRPLLSENHTKCSISGDDGQAMTMTQRTNTWYVDIRSNAKSLQGLYQSSRTNQETSPEDKIQLIS